MGGVEKRTISLPAAEARSIDDLVAAGGYASASDVVRTGRRGGAAADGLGEERNAFRPTRHATSARCLARVVASPFRPRPHNDVCAAAAPTDVTATPPLPGCFGISPERRDTASPCP